MAAPLALFASCSNDDAEHLIKEILSIKDLTGGTNVVEDIASYPWCIDTRYFTAEIELCFTQNRTIGNAGFAERVEAFILLFDTQEVTSFAKVKLWLPYLKQIEPEIRLLICTRCGSADAITRENAWEWCLENGFELIELDPEIEENSDEEDDFKETTGVNRIIQALHAHTWPNLVMKEKPSYRSSLMTQLMRDEARAKQEETSNNTKSTAMKTTIQHSNPENTNIIDSSITNDANESHFEVVFNKTENQADCNLSDLPNPFLDQLTTNSKNVIAKSEKTVTEGFSDDFSKFDSLKISDTETKSVVSGSDKKDSSSVNSSSQEVLQHSNAEGIEEDIGFANKVAEGPGGNTERNNQSDPIPEPVIGEDQLKALTALGSDDPHPEDFGDLFEKLKGMKEQAENLPLPQRKLYAEKVAIQFWKAIGGDDDEIDGLSSDED